MPAILGVRIDGPSKEAFRSWATHVFRSNMRGRAVYTPNAEMLVRASKRPDFKQVLNDAAMTLCDSRGVQLFLSTDISRFTGVDAMIDLMRIAGREEKTVYLLGSGRQETLDRLTVVLRTQFPQIQIVGSHIGPSITIERASIHYDSEEDDRIVQDIIMADPDVLFVAFGHEKQERWIHDHIDVLPRIQIMIGVGGAFDVLSGRIPRAPKVWRDVGLEWLWRLIREPRRFGRIATATMVFPFLAMKDTLQRIYDI